MRIGIFGKGSVGSALATGWLRGGHSVVMGVREPAGAALKAGFAGEMSPEFATAQAAAEQSEVLVFALPAQATVDVARELASIPGIGDRGIIDASNSLFGRPEGFNSAYEGLRSVLAADVIKCFTTTGAENMLHPAYADGALDMFLAGGDPDAKATVVTLARDLGFAECYDAGGPEAAPVLEQLAALWIQLAMKGGLGRNIGLRLVRR